MNQDLERTIEFILELDKLKGVLRKTRPLGLDRNENSAEHSWQVAMLAVLMAGYSHEPLDMGRVIELLLVHDIPEIDAGDQIVYQGVSEARAAAELRAAERIFGLLPATLSAWCTSRWQEFETRETPEARFAYAMDRLMPVLHNLHNNGQSWRENGIGLERVRAANAAIESACPAVGAHVQSLLAAFESTPGLSLSTDGRGGPEQEAASRV